MSINLHRSSNINLDWTIGPAPTDQAAAGDGAAGQRLSRRGRRLPPYDTFGPVGFAAERGESAGGEPAPGAPTPLRQSMLAYLASVGALSPPAGSASGSLSRDLSAGPGGNWAPVARQGDIDRVSPLRPAAAGRGVHAWDCNDLTKSLTKWGHDAPRLSVTQEAFCPPAYAIIRGRGQVTKKVSGEDPSPYEQGLDRRPVQSGEGPRRHLNSQVDIQEDKKLLRLPDRSDNEQFKAAKNPRVQDASALPEAGARLSSFEGEGGREGTIVDYQGKMHHPDLDSRHVRRKAPVHTQGVRIYEPNIATVKVRDWGHDPVTATVTKDHFFSEKALQYATEEAARKAHAGAAFDSRTKPTVRNPPMYATFSGEGNRRHLATQFSTKEDPSLTIPDRSDNETYKAAPGKIDATQLPEAGAHHTALDDKDLTLFPLNKQRLAQPTENPGVRLLDQTPGTELGTWSHPRVRSTQTMDDYQPPPLPPPPGTAGDVKGAGFGGKVGDEAPGTRSGLDPRRHLATQFTTKVPGVTGGAENGTVKLEMRTDVAPRDIPMAGTAATSRQGIAGDLPVTATRDQPAPAVAIGAAGKVHDKPRQVGPRTNKILDQTLSSVVISHEFNEATPPPPPEKRSQRRLAPGRIAAQVYKTHRFEPVEPARHTYKYRQTTPPPPPRLEKLPLGKDEQGARMTGDPRDREWHSSHTNVAEPVVPPWGDDEYHLKPDPSRSRATDTYRQTHNLSDQEAHLRPGSPRASGLVGGLEPANPYAAPSTKHVVEKPVRIRVSDSVRTSLPRRWDGEEQHPEGSPFARSATTGAEVGAEAEPEDIVRIDPLRTASALLFGPGTSIPGLGKRPDGGNSLTADYTSRDQLRFEHSVLQPRVEPKVTNTMRVSRPLDNPVDTEPDHDGPSKAAPTTAKEIDFHDRSLGPRRVNAGAHLARGTSFLGTKPDGEGFRADVQTTDFNRYVPPSRAIGAGTAPYETQTTDFATTAQDIAPRDVNAPGPRGSPSKTPSTGRKLSPRRKAPSTKEMLAKLAAKLSVGGGGVSGSKPSDPPAGNFVAEGPSSSLPAHSPTARSSGGTSSGWLALHGNPDAPPPEPTTLHRDQSEAKTWTTTAGELGSNRTAGAAWTGGSAAAEGETTKGSGMRAKVSHPETAVLEAKKNEDFVAGARPKPYVLPSMRREYEKQEREREAEEDARIRQLSPQSQARNSGEHSQNSRARSKQTRQHATTRPSSPADQSGSNATASRPPAGGGPMATVRTASAPSTGVAPAPASAPKAKGRWVHLKFIQKALAVARGRSDSL